MSRRAILLCRRTHFIGWFSSPIQPISTLFSLIGVLEGVKRFLIIFDFRQRVI